jgi:hypothetical protein
MRHLLRKCFDFVVGRVPVAIIRGLLKSFYNHPEFAERAGFQVHPKVFYSPLPDPMEVNRGALREKRQLPGIELAGERSIDLLRQLACFSNELAEVPRQKTAGALMWYENGTYADFDAATLYAMLRHLKPACYIEVGCGFSSRMSTLALNRNAEEGSPCACTYIEPYPPSHLAGIKLAGKLLKQKIQETPLVFFQQLQAGDVLFIDTSHVLKVQNDVEFELVHVLPSLKPGVWVHIHDIFTPYDYPEEWLVGRVRGGVNEQYALECLLSGGDDWEVVLPVHWLWREHRAELARLMAGAVERPAAFWIRKRERQP